MVRNIAATSSSPLKKNCRREARSRFARRYSGDVKTAKYGSRAAKRSQRGLDSAMNLILLFDGDFIAEHRVRLTGRRAQHIAGVHRTSEGDELVAGVAGGKLGLARVTSMSDDAVELDVTLDRDPPPPLELTLVLALPRPKVLNRVVAAATSMGIKRMFLINAWRVEKSYWSSPRLSPENLRQQSILGLEQARDTVLPSIALHRFFRRFVELELPSIATGTRALVAHPPARTPCPRDVREPVTLAIGPEGGFIDEEVASLERAGFEAVSIGERILRVETAVAWAVSRVLPPCQERVTLSP